MGRGGFTFVEILILLIIFAILFSVAIPKFIGYRRDAIKGLETATVGAIESGLRIYSFESNVRDRTPEFPPTLDSAAYGDAKKNNPFFINILKPPGSTKYWEKLNDYDYISPTEATYRYDPTNGTFEKL